MKITSRIDWMKARYEFEKQKLESSLRYISQYHDKTPEDAQRMFDAMPAVMTFRRNGWLNEEERWAIAFYAQKLPRRTKRRSCSAHLYEIAAKFDVSLATVYRYSNYEG